MGHCNKAGQTFCTLFYPGRLRLPQFARRALLGALFLGFPIAHAQYSNPGCTQLLQAQDARAVAVCKTQVDQAESAPATERMPRMVAYDEYGIALLAIAHQ